MKKVLNKKDFETFKQIGRGELDSELGDIMDSQKSEDLFMQETQQKPKPKNVLESGFEDLSDDESVYNVYWEEFEKRAIRRKEREVEMLNDPMLLLDKLETYSKNLYRNLSSDDKKELMRQIEYFLDEGVTPLKKYYDELKQHFSMPSQNLLEFERNQFKKQISMIRKAQGKEIEQMKHMAMIKAKGVMQNLVDNANQVVKKEMTSIVKQYNFMSDELQKRKREIEIK